MISGATGPAVDMSMSPAVNRRGAAVRGAAPAWVPSLADCVAWMDPDENVTFFTEGDPGEVRLWQDRLQADSDADRLRARAYTSPVRCPVAWAASDLSTVMGFSTDRYFFDDSAHWLSLPRDRSVLWVAAAVRIVTLPGNDQNILSWGINGSTSSWRACLRVRTDGRPHIGGRRVDAGAYGGTNQSGAIEAWSALRLIMGVWDVANNTLELWEDGERTRLRTDWSDDGAVTTWPDTDSGGIRIGRHDLGGAMEIGHMLIGTQRPSEAKRKAIEAWFLTKHPSIVLAGD